MRTTHAEACDHATEAGDYSQPLPSRSTVLLYCRRKLRTAAIVTAVAAVPAFAAVLSTHTAVHLMALAYLVLLVLACDRLKSLAEVRRSAVVVSDYGISVAAQGLQLRWQDVKRISEVRTRSAKAIDIELRWPEAFRDHASRSVRFGAWCQRALRLPAITLSLWLLDAGAETFIHAVGLHRPDLLHVNNRTDRTD